MVLGAEVYPKMPQKKSKAVLKGNGHVPQDTYAKLDGITLEELRRIMSEALDKAFDEPTKNMGREISA